MEVGRVEAGLYLSDKGFDSGLATAGSKLDTFGSKIDSVAQKAGEIGQSLTMGLTLPIAGAAAGVLKLAGDFEQSMANVASVTGGGVEAQKALSAAAREAGATTVFSASQAADAMYYMASAGWKDQQIVAGLNDTLKLAAAGGKDLAFTSDLMTATISQFGLGAEDAGRVANVFAAATSNSQANLDKLAYSMRYVGPIANSLGWSLEETTGGLMGLYNAGFKGEQAGTVLRGALSALLKPSDAAAETLKQLGLSIEDVNPATHSLAEIIGVLESKNLSAAQAVAIFGQEAGPGMLALLGQGQDALEGYTASITGTSKATEMMETQTNTLWGALKQLRSAGEELALVFGDVLIPPLTSLVKDTITPFVRKLGEMDSGTVKLIATIAGLAAVVGPALILFSQMIPALALIVGAVGALVSPLGLVAAAFAALAGYEVHKHFDAIASAFGHIKDVAFELFGALSQGNITEAFDILRAEAGNFVKYLSDVDWGEMFRGLQSDTKSAFKKAVSAAQSVWSGLRGIANSVASWLRAVDWGGVWDTVVLGAYTAFGALHDLGDYILEGFQSIDWGGIWTELRGIGSYIVSSLKSVNWSSIASTIGSGLRSAFETLTDLGGAIVDKLKAIDWRGVGDTILGLIGQGFGALSDVGETLYEALTSYDWSNLADKITSGLADIGGAIGSYIKEKLAAIEWAEVGHKILDGIKTVFGAARDLGDYLAAAIEGYDWSPVGETVAKWLKKGVQKGWDLLKWIGEKISGISTSDATNTFSGWFNAVKGAFSEFWSGFSEEMTGGAGWKAAFIELFWEAFDYVVGLLGRWGSEIKNSIKGHLAEILTKVDLWTIDFINLWIYAVNGALDSAYNFRDWISPIFDEAVGAVTKKLDEIGATKAFEDLKAAAEAPIATVKGWVDALKDAIQGLIDTASNVVNVGGYLETLASTLGIGAQWYESVGRSSGDMGGRYFMTEAEKAAWEEEHPAWKLQVSENQSNFSLPTTQTQVPGIPQAEVSLSGENVVFTTDQGTSTATQGQLGYVDYSKLGQILEGTPGYGAIWPQGGWLTKLLTGTGNADYSALFGEVAGSVIRPEGRTYLSPVGSLGYEETLAGWQDRLGYKIDAQTDEVTSSWKSTGDAVHSDLEAMRAEEAATAASVGSIAGTIPNVASATTETAGNTAAFPAGLQSISSQIASMPANLQGWLSRSLSSSQQAQGYQPGQILSREEVAGFANAVTYAISPATGKLTAYIGSAGKELEKLAINGGEEIVGAGKDLADSVYVSSNYASGATIRSAQQSSAIQLGGAYQRNDILQIGTRQANQATIDTSNAVSLSQLATNETVTSGWLSSSAAARQNILSGGQSFFGDIYSSGNIWKDAADWAAANQKTASSESGATWNTAVDNSGQTIQTAADAIGNAGGVFIDSMGSLMSSLARVVGSGGGITYTAGGGTTSGTGYSYSSGGMCGELGPPMHGYNALIYTAPSGEVYAINPMTFQSVGGISGAISSGAATKLTTSKSSGGSLSSSKSSGGSLSYSSGWLKSAPKSQKAIVTNYGTWGSYAEGGVAIGPQLAVVGDNPSRREAIIPEEVWGDKGGNGGDVTVIVEMDSRQIAKAVMPRAAKSIRIRTNAKVN